MKVTVSQDITKTRPLNPDFCRYEDNCGVYWPFLPDRNVPIECNSDESHTPGTFCVKITKQGPRGFICKLVTLLRKLI